MKNFIRISNEWLTNAEQGNIFERIGTEGFTIYCVLLQIKGNRDKFQVSIKQIQQLLNKDYNNKKSKGKKKERSQVKYSAKKINYINVVKDPRTMKKYLNLLKKAKLIDTEHDIDKIRVDDYIVIDVLESDYTKGFTPIACDLILNKIHKIGHIGFSLLYILTNLFNRTFGGETCVGFANPSEKYLSNIIKRDVNTVSAYLRLLEEKLLIKILPQPRVSLGEDKNCNEIYQYIPNHYIVNNRLPENKYYIEFKK